MSESVIGTCSKCGGRVTVPTLWGGIYPPTPTCVSCGATKKQHNGPVIEMDEPKKSDGYLCGAESFK